MVFVQIVDEYSVTRCTEMMGQRMHPRTEMIWQRFQMPWISSSRILHYSLGHDFTNTIDLSTHEKFEGGEYFDIDTGKFYVIDYIHGSHGDFAIAQTVGPPEWDVFLISLVETSVGHRILNATRVMQRLWRTGIPQHMASSRDMHAAKCTSSFACAVFSRQVLRYQIGRYLRHVRGIYELADIISDIRGMEDSTIS